MKRQNTLDTKKCLVGLNYGDHGVNEGALVDELDLLIAGTADVFVVRCHPDHPFSDQTYYGIAKYAKSRNVSFFILYSYQHPPKGRRSHLSPEIVKGIYEIAGDLFLGEIFAETGSQSCSMCEGYYVEVENDNLVMPEQDFADMSAARKRYVDFIRTMTDYDRDVLGIKNTAMVEPTAISAYALEGGIGIPMLEVLPGDVEKLIPFTRGAAIGYEKSTFGGFIAHEWYGGYRHDDTMKKKRLDLTYKYLYMQGAGYVFLESGNTEVKSFGFEAGYDSELCRYYRDTTKRFYNFYKENPRPSCGPYTKVAFVFGEDDGYADFLGGSAWCQFGREEWSKGDSENSWRILSEVYRSYSWHEQEGFAHGGLDLSGSPAYGSYDVIPAASPLSVMSGYDYLIFVGHNTMNTELYKKLCDYVEDGGVLLMAASHLATDSCRTGPHKYINDGDFSELFGARMTGTVRKNNGIKFRPYSIVKNLKYPGTENMECDANYPAGYCDYAYLALSGAECAALLSDSFDPPSEDALPALIENKKGKGCALLFSHLVYPGSPAFYTVYRVVVKALLSVSHASADMQVTGSDKVRYSLLYDEGGREVLYLLNTAFDDSSSVTVRYKGTKIPVTLDPCELKSIEF